MVTLDSPSFTSLINYLVGFTTAILAIYIKKAIDDRDLRKRTLLTLKNEIQDNVGLLEKATRIYVLNSVAWQTMSSYVVLKETPLFKTLSDLYSSINIRNNIMMVHNMALSAGKIYKLEIEGKYVHSGEWLDNDARQLKGNGIKAIRELDARLAQIMDCP